MIDISSLGINPGFAAITALWFATYCLAIAWLYRCARANLVSVIWFWLIVILLIPAGQFVAMLYCFRVSRLSVD